MINVLNKHTKGVSGSYVGRGTPLGNPFRAKNETDRERVIVLYRQWLWDRMREKGSPAAKMLDGLTKTYIRTGKLNLVCWCAPKKCHAEIIRAAILWKSKQR